MNTLSIFPDLLTFGLIAPLLLRVIAGFIFIHLGYKKVHKNKYSWIIPYAEIIGGIFLILGLFTQAVALILSFFILYTMYKKIRQPNLHNNSIEFFILLLTVLLSLLFLGAGFFAIDLPI